MKEQKDEGEGMWEGETTRERGDQGRLREGMGGGTGGETSETSETKVRCVYDWWGLQSQGVCQETETETDPGKCSKGASRI